MYAALGARSLAHDAERCLVHVLFLIGIRRTRLLRAGWTLDRPRRNGELRQAALTLLDRLGCPVVSLGELQTMRMGMRRLTRLTNGFSKKVENLAAAMALNFMYYNFARRHKTLGPKVSPAMAAGISDHLWMVEEICRLLESN